MTSILPISIILNISRYLENDDYRKIIILNKKTYRYSETDTVKRLYILNVNIIKDMICNRLCFTSLCIRELDGKNVRYMCNEKVKDDNSIFCNFCNALKCSTISEVYKV